MLDAVPEGIQGEHWPKVSVTISSSRVATVWLKKPLWREGRPARWVVKVVSSPAIISGEILGGRSVVTISISSLRVYRQFELGVKLCIDTLYGYERGSE